MHKHHSFEEKLKCMKLLEEGYSMSQLSRDFKICRAHLYDWQNRYLVYGEEGLKRKVAHSVSEVEKALIRTEMAENPLPLKDLCIKYDISQSVIYNLRKTKGKLRHRMTKQKKNALLTELEELRARNEYLEAENALLKKVKALVEARDARRKGTGQKPSSN